MHRSSNRRRSPWLLAIVCAALCLVAACGDGDQDSSDPNPSSQTQSDPTQSEPSPSGEAEEKAQALTKAQLKTALLTRADVGARYRKTRADRSDGSEDSEGSDPSDIGCLKKLDTIEEPEGDAPEVEVAFEKAGDISSSEIDNSVTSLSTPDVAEKMLDQMANAFAECRKLAISEEGVTLKGNVTTNTDMTIDGVDQQLNVLVRGKAIYRDVRFPITFRWAFVRMGNNLAYVSLIDLGPSDPQQFAGLVSTAVSRLGSVMDDSA
ncbi:hypothetical protein KV100_03185 [Mumia sp. zg.B21]|uniref:hypothetical protein n=1 Tax=Mumia sp. zg.B21 TaxID=2855447 RepID=UPI001C6EDED2|nr:hypothetical protein [Mumia sp. zg.B21]MBW9208645.1 hypothetical protein [Mumia sp. zg.B21]